MLPWLCCVVKQILKYAHQHIALQTTLEKEKTKKEKILSNAVLCCYKRKQKT